MSEKSNRHAAVSELELEHNSLLGSYFHGKEEDGGLTQGCIVAEIQPGVYLAEFFEWLTGIDSTHQSIVRIEDMLDWKFYDTAEWMNNAYHSSHPG